MKATIVDLRYRMKDVLKALERNEQVEILYHGKVKGIIHPVNEGFPKTKFKSADFAFCGMTKNSMRSVEEEMDILRGGRFRDL